MCVDQQMHRTRDPIIEEIHETRRKIAEKFGSDIRAIADDARKRQAASGHPIWKGKKSDANHDDAT